jgi:hypothetical protein
MSAMAAATATLLLLCLSTCTFVWSVSAHAHDDGFVLGAYLPEYRDYIPLNESAVFLTDLYLFSAAPTEHMGKYQLSYCCFNNHHYDLARKARAYNNEAGKDPLRLWLTVGGAQRSDHFLQDPDGLIAAIQLVVKEQQLDGVVLDCERFRHQDDYLMYMKWIMKASSILRRDDILVAVTLHVGQFLVPHAYPDLDQVHLMAYDIPGEYHADPVAVKAAVDQLVHSGCPLNKIILGIPAYARHERNRGDVKTYAEIIDELERSHSHANLKDSRNWKGYRGESTQTVKAKVAWAAERQLGGVFFWELGQDKHHTTAPGGLLLEAAAMAIDNKGKLVQDEL